MTHKSKFLVRHQYDETDELYHGEVTATHNTEPSLTQQHFTEDADLNIMVARMGLTDGSQIPPYFHESVTGDKFGDFSDAPDFRTAMDRLKEAADAFNLLPAKIRKEFNNDPAQLMQFLEDPNNDERAVELGLLNKMPEELPEGVTTRRELAKWAKANTGEAIDLGILTAVAAPDPKPIPVTKLSP